MSTDLRERVARAISRTRREDNEGYWKQYLPEADAVLAELGPELAIDKLIRDTHKAGGSAELRVTVQADGVLHVLPQHGRPPMADLDKAIAAFRESIREGVVDWQVIRAGSNLLAALDAARGEAVAYAPKGDAMFEPEWAVTNPILYSTDADDRVPLYAAPPAALAVPDGMRNAEQTLALLIRKHGDEADAAALAMLTQQPAAAVPEGYALVPVEPTREMIEAGIMFGNSPNKAAIIWQNMLAAAEREGE